MKNKVKKIIRISLAILLVTVIQITGVTYAKYISSEKGYGQAEVAKWAFEIIKDGEETKNIKLVDTTNKSTLVNGKIAPGTSGKIFIAVDATGAEVDMEYTLEFINEQNKPKNLVFTYMGSQYNSLSEIQGIQGKIKYNDETKTRGIQVSWKWAYETGTSDEEKSKNNEVDTENASTITEYTFDVVVTATQSK